MTTLKHVFWTFLLFCTTSLLADTWTDENGVVWFYTISRGTARIGDGTNAAIPTTTVGDIIVPGAIYGYPVSQISNNAFKNCSTITKVSLPDSITDLGAYAFYYCPELTEVNIPPLVKTLYSDTFWGCSKLTKVVISGSVTSIGASCFYECSSLQELDIPASVTSVGESCFSRCSALERLNLSASLTFPKESLSWCPNLLIPSKALLEADSLRYNSSVAFEKGRTTFNSAWINSSLYSVDTVQKLVLPSTVGTATIAKMSSGAPSINILNLHISGPYRKMEGLFSVCTKITFDPEYADEWEAQQPGWFCERSRLSVVSTLHGGTTSEKGKEVAWGEEVSVTAAAKEGYVFLGWDSDREGIEGTEETITFTMPQAPVTLVANFFPKALLEGWMDTRIDAKVDGERLMTADQAAEKTAAAIEGKVESGELFTPAGAEAKAAEEIAQKVANKELITADSLQEMALDTPVIEVDASGTAKVGISLQKASSLSGDWEEVVLAEDAASVSAGALKLTVPAEEGTAFYKFVVPARQGAQEP